MSSRRAARPQPRSHARPKGGFRARNVVLAVGALTVTAGVAVTLATGGSDASGGTADRVTTNAAGDVPGGADAGADSTDPLALPSASPSVAASPTPSVKASAKPKQPSKPAASPKVEAKSGSGTGSSGSGGRTAVTPRSGSGSASGGSGGSSNGAEAQVLTLVNKERASAGCSPLTSNAKLVEAADDYSDVMAGSGVMSHTGPDGSTMSGRVDAAGYVWSTLGENIARGQSDAAAVMDAWMHSPGHRANILNCSFKEIGIGVHFGDGGPWWTQDFGAGR
ncbi:CAP domain-containing protein [Streptomyces sp. NBC_01210]|uniref:CAP domain-containing protein n=1 Tax=Streptomyces sp. NBC_01210 TaxID=2903774 RepID=UPI002E1585B5|nr:CAP domain-containing protein [Streptomyces sp. NBC_01210]